MSRPDPMETIIREALIENRINFLEEEENPARLDFYLVDHEIYIEVKQFHSPRIAEQMSRANNVIAIQGIKAAKFFADFIRQ